MKIGIIGAGLIGKCLAQKLSEKGHHILIANSRGPGTIDFADNEKIEAVEVRQTFSGADVIIITIPFGKVRDLPKDLFDKLDPDIPIIETMNYFPQRDGVIDDLENGKTHSIWVEEQIGRPVVKAFSNIVAHSFIKGGLPKGTPGRIALAVSGDRSDWVDIAMQLVDETGFDGYDAGPIAESWRQQPVNPAYCADLTVEELKQALERADRKQAIVTRDISTKMISALGEDYYRIILIGDYPENFEDKVVNIYRSLNEIPLK